MKKLLFISALMMICSFSNAQISQFQALYIYNFAKNTNWPIEDANRDLSITIIGDNDLTAELNKLAKTKTVGNRKVVINQAATTSGLQKSDIIFLGESKNNFINTLVNAQQGKKVLIVCGKKGQCSNGACISFVSENGKLNFEISEQNISHAGLSVSQKLISLGTKID